MRRPVIQIAAIYHSEKGSEERERDQRGKCFLERESLNERAPALRRCKFSYQKRRERRVEKVEGCQIKKKEIRREQRRGY